MYLKKAIWILFSVIMIVAFQSLKTSPHEAAQETALIPRSLLFDNPVKAAPRLSSQGTMLAYLAPDANNVLNVWVKDLSRDEPERMVTCDIKRGIRNYLWQYNQEHILYIQDKDGDENWHLYQTSLLSGETKDLTPYEGVTVDIVAYNHDSPDEILIQMNHRNPNLYDVYRINLTSAEMKLDTENPGQVISWLADHSLHVRGSTSMTADGSTLISVREGVDTPWREVLSLDAMELGGELVGFSEDGNALYLLSSLGGNTVRLLQLEVKTGQLQLIQENASYDIAEVMINPLTHRLEAIGYEGEKYALQSLDPQLTADFNWLQQEMGNPFRIVSRDLTNQHWILAGISDVQPTRHYLYQRSNKDLKFLFSTQPALEKYVLSPMQPISYAARDGMKLYGYLTLPAGKEPKNLPLILMVHGGPWVRDQWGFDIGAQWLANRGYAVLRINYRGSDGYGKAYLNAGNREWGRKMHLDLLDGKQWAIDAGIADANKVAIYGGSYGGYATLAGLAFTPDEFCCGVDIVGPSNLITLMQTLPPYWSPLKAQMDLRIGSLETEPQFLQECSPLFKATQIKKPLLIAQGANDPRVKQAESDRIVEAMRQKNLPVEYLLFPDEGHGFARPQNRLKFYAASEAFLSKYLGGRHEAPSENENWQSLKR